MTPAAVLSELAAEFPGYEFATQRTWSGIAIVACRHPGSERPGSQRPGSERPGLYAVITGDPDEMRRALLEHEETGC